MNRRCTLGLCVIALILTAAFPSSATAQGKTLKDQLVGTWIYVSSTGKREDGSSVPRPALQGAVTYTADGRFHFITTRTDLPKYVSNETTRPSPEEAMAVASGSIAYTGTYTVDESTKTVHANVDHAGAGFDHVAGHEFRPADGGNEHVGAARDRREIAALRMADGDARILLQEEQRERLADDIGAADDERLRAGKRHAAVLEEPHHARRRAGHHAR